MMYMRGLYIDWQEPSRVGEGGGWMVVFATMMTGNAMNKQTNKQMANEPLDSNIHMRSKKRTR